MKRALVFSLAGSLLALGGCDQVKKIDEGESGDSGPSSQVPDAVQQRLTQSCALAGCHVSGGSIVDLSEASGGAWVSQSGPGGPYVTFGDVGNSYLAARMLDPAAGSVMPIGAGMITAEDRAVIIGWIAGAEFPDGDEGGETDPTDGTDSDGSETSGNSDLVECSIDAVAPAGTESPVVSGDQAGMIPAAVGEALERNCGCHYTSTVSDPALYFPFSGGTQLQTLANFTNLYAGANAAYMDQPAWVAVEDRVINQRNMPTAVCETEDGGIISSADFALFEAWFDQEVPDGASFTPPS
jgi:hypothetical protein